MNLILSGRGVELDDSLRSYATEKLSRVERFFDRIIKMEVELRHERNPRVKDPDRVEITVKTPMQTLRVHGEGLDHRAAIDMASDRLEAQMRKHKDKHVAHHNHHKPVRDAVPADDDHDTGGVDIIRMEPLVDKPLTVEEARLELDERNLAFLPFTDADTMRCSVLYKRDDGAYGLIDQGN